MKKKILFCLSFVVLSIGLNAQIYCPDDIVVSCLSDLTPDECGMATVVSGNYHPSMVKYVDQSEINACNEGTVFRKFYLDVDYSNTYSENEPSCIQTITLEYNSLPLNIQFPQDREYSCLDEVPVDHPTWLSNPCDLIGYTYVDEVFEFEAGACLKIVRTFSVINWCVYDVNAQDGLVKGIQIIKIVDDVAPEIDNCEDQYFDATTNCEAFVKLTNSASDVGDCPSGTLSWSASVDLWGDGTEDLFFGPNEPMPFRLNPVASGDIVEVEIPEALGIARHKIVWKVTDGCGNVRTCPAEFFVEDNKPPTPYCLDFTSSTLNGNDNGELIIPASFFNIDAVDNCSSKESIRFSFSENIDDTEKVILCGDTGFQFFRIYYTDEAGNQDFCEVFMLIFDNGTCFGKYAPSGFITRPDGTPIENATAYLMEIDNVITEIESNASGYFSFGDQDLMEDYTAVVKKEDGSLEDVDIEDFIMMRSALVGLTQLDVYQKIAADINQDRSLDIHDLYEFRDVLLNKSEIKAEDLWNFVPKMLDLNSNTNDIEFDASIPYIAYGDGFDFYGVKTGDITGSYFSIQEIAEDVEEEIVELILEISNEKINIIAKKNFISDAIQFDLGFSLEKEINFDENEALKAIGNGLRYLDLNPSKEIVDDQVLLSLNSVSQDLNTIENIVNDAKVFLKGANNASTIDWTIVDKRNHGSTIIEASNIQVYPMPFKNNLNINASGITNLSMFSVTGEQVEIKSLIELNSAKINIESHLPRGVYFLKVSKQEGDQIIKVVK